MTGYGRVETTINETEITVEIKSVNSRYLDLNIKTPRIYAFLDDSIKKCITKNIARGKVDVYISIDTSKTNDTKIEINENMLVEYLQVLRNTCEKHNLKDDISIMSIAKLPDMIKVSKKEEDLEKLKQDVLCVLDMALIKYNDMREKEGAELCKDMLYRKDLICDMVKKIEEKSPQTVENYKNRLFEKLKDVLENTTITEDRILLESAVFADKTSVCEETVRLISHTNQLVDICALNEPVGRKLDFLIQEFNREANTIGSKANDTELSKIVIELKGEIEKIREQVQNVE